MKMAMKAGLVLVLAATTLVGCNCFKKMAKNSDDLSVSCNPELLALNHGIVEADVTASVPVKYFNKKAIVRVTPIMVFEGGEVAGTPKIYQGSKVKENYTVITNEGGTFTQHVEFPFDERMRISELRLRFEGKCKPDAEWQMVNAQTGKIISAEDLANDPSLSQSGALLVAEGVNTLQQDLMIADAMTAMPSNYKRVTTEVNKSDIRYAISSSTVSSSALKAADLDAFKADVKAKQANPRATQHIAVKGYASPDGPEKFNDRLSKQRSESGDRAIERALRGLGMDVDVAAYGEDWEGFQELVRSSNIQDKEMILQVLSMYNSSTQREEEIKNMSSVYGELKSDVLPALRRSSIVNSTDLVGKSDEEMMALVNENRLGELKINELLYIAEMSQDDAIRTRVLEYAAANHNDVRAVNNLAVQQMRNGEEAKSLATLEKAAATSSDQAITNNLALANAANGNMEEAAEYAKGADARTKSAVEALNGNYAQAAQQLEGYNAAVAHTMNQDFAAAKRVLADDNSAKADYLRGVIASREGDMRTSESMLKSAVAKDSSLAARAKTDIHFKELFEGGLKL